MQAVFANLEQISHWVVTARHASDIIDFGQQPAPLSFLRTFAKPGARYRCNAGGGMSRSGFGSPPR